MIGFLESRRHARLQRLLSAYLDGEVSDSERAGVDTHLAGCESCRSELATLRATVDLLGSLPQIAPSRSFALAQEPEPVRSFEPLFWTARAVAPIAAVLLVALVVGDSVGLITQQKDLEPIFFEVATEVEGAALATVAAALATVAAAPAPEAAAAAPIAATEMAVEKEVVEVQIERTVEVAKEVVKAVEVPAAPQAPTAPAVADEAAAERAVEALDATSIPAPESTPATAMRAAPPPPAAGAAPTAVAKEVPVERQVSQPAPTAAAAVGAAAAEEKAMEEPGATSVPPSVSTPQPLPSTVETAAIAPVETQPAVQKAPTFVDLDSTGEDEGLELPLWQLEVATAIVILFALIAAFAVSRRSSTRRWSA